MRYSIYLNHAMIYSRAPTHGIDLVCLWGGSVGQVAGGEDTIEAVAAKCVGYVGADIAALAREAALSAARQVPSWLVVVS